MFSLFEFDGIRRSIVPVSPDFRVVQWDEMDDPSFIVFGKTHPFEAQFIGCNPAELRNEAEALCQVTVSGALRLKVTPGSHTSPPMSVTKRKT